MPSVRVKRANGYSFLQDASHDAAGTPGTSHRPRRRSSVAALLTPHPDPSLTLDFPMQTRPTAATDSSLSRRPPISLSTAGRASANESDVRPLRPRSSSRVSNHIMSSTRTPAGPLRHISEEHDPFAAAAGAAVQEEKPRNRHESFSLSRHHEGEDDDMISLEGPQTDVLVPRTENGPGRVESSLSLPGSERSDYADYDNNDDGEHHPDDIVEHLDVIGTSCCTMLCTLKLSRVPSRPSDRYGGNAHECRQRDCHVRHRIRAE